MAKKRKNTNPEWFRNTEAKQPEEAIEPVEEFVEESIEEFGELFEEVETEAVEETVKVEPEVAPEPEVEPEVAPEPKVQNSSGRLLVTSLRAWVYPEPDIFTKPVTGVARGNQILKVDGPLIDADGKKQWFEVEVPLVEGRVKGFIELVRVKEL